MSANPLPDLHCDRVRRLLSLRLDDEATEQQLGEIEAHVPECAECRAAQVADGAVRARMATPAGTPADFVERVVAGLSRQRLEARAQNRFLMGAAAAAVLVACAASLSFGPPRPLRSTVEGVPVADGSPREIAGTALSTTLAFGRAPRLGAEDR